MTAPERTRKQRLDALDEANRIRQYRAREKRDLAAGRRDFATVLDDEDFATSKVLDVLLTLPKYGRVKVHKVLTQCRISPSKTLGGLTDRQREELLRHLSLRAPATRLAGPPAEALELDAEEVELVPADTPPRDYLREPLESGPLTGFYAGEPVNGDASRRELERELTRRRRAEEAAR